MDEGILSRLFTLPLLVEKHDKTLKTHSIPTLDEPLFHPVVLIKLPGTRGLI